MKELSIKASFKIALRSKWVARIITILLSAFSFALFAIASTGFLYNRMDYYAQSLYNEFQSGIVPFIGFNSFLHNSNTNDYRIDQEMITHIKKETNISAYIYGLNTAVPFRFSKYAKNAYIGDPEWFNKIDHSASIDFWFGNDSTYNEFGFQLLAGRYPQNEYEVALSKQHFEFFTKAGGYYDISDRYKLVTDGKLEDGSQPWEDQLVMGPYDDGYWFDNISDFDLSTAVPINCYEDLLGKEFLCYGTTESGEQDLKTIYKMKVVGVTDVKVGYGRIQLSEKWLEAYHQEVQYMVARPKEITKELARACIDLTFDLAEDYEQKTGNHNFNDRFMVGEKSAVGLIRNNDMFGSFNDENAIQLIGIFAGLFLGIFAVLLNGHVITASLELKRKQVGVLRSMGASEKSVRRIFMLEALFIGLCAFLVALGLSIGAHFGFLKPALTSNEYNTCPLIYNGWTVLLLAVISIGVPLLCSLLPLKKFFKKPIVENISGNSSQK